MKDCSDGARPPPPIPCTMRATTSIERLGAIPQKKDDTVNRNTETM